MHRHIKSAHGELNIPNARFDYLHLDFEVPLPPFPRFYVHSYNCRQIYALARSLPVKHFVPVLRFTCKNAHIFLIQITAYRINEQLKQNQLSSFTVLHTKEFYKAFVSG